MPPIKTLNARFPSESVGTFPADVFSLPPLMRIPDACRWSGCTRTRPYQLAGSGDVIFRKMGKATLVDVASLRNYLTALPVAAIKQQNTATKAAAA